MRNQTNLQETLDNHKKSWGIGVETANLEAVMSLYSDDAILKPTLSDKIRKGLSDISSYFSGINENSGKGFLKNNIVEVKFLNSETCFFENTIIDVGQYTFRKEGSEPILADYTFVLNANNTKIISHHSSLTFSE